MTGNHPWHHLTRHDRLWKITHNQLTDTDRALFTHEDHAAQKRFMRRREDEADLITKDE